MARKSKKGEEAFKVPDMTKKEEIIEIKEERKIEPKQEPKIEPKPKQKKKFMLPKDQGEQIAEILKTPAKEEFAPSEEILLVQIEEDGRARYIPARWTGKSEVLVDEETHEMFKLTESNIEEGKVEAPPFFDLPHQVATNPISLLFLSLAKFFGMKTVWHRTLLYLPHNVKPFNWKKQRQDGLTGKEWNATVDMGAYHAASAMFQKQGMSNIILYVLIGFGIILGFAILMSLQGG